MRIAIRADSSFEIGTGHVMRCLALANELRDRGAEIRFVCRDHPGNLVSLLKEAGYTTVALPAPRTARNQGTGGYAGWLGVEQSEDAAETLAALGTFTPEWVVVDHYALSAPWEQVIRSTAARILAVDDLANRAHDCDCLLDQNYHEEAEARYQGLVAEECRKLLGPHYALLRPEFARARQTLRPRSGVVRRLLVFFGGVDATNETTKAVQALGALGREDVEVDVLIGSGNRHRDALIRSCAPVRNVRLHCNVENMAQLMASADLAVGAGGSSTWERLCVGLPAIVISVSENQHQGSRALAKTGSVLYLGDAAHASATLLRSTLEVACSSPDLLSSMSGCGSKLVDGAGARRVAESLMRRPLELRPATQDDCGRLHSWRNAEEVRRFSGDDAHIPYERHVEWCAKVLANPEQTLLIGEIGGMAVGVLRYDREGDDVTVSVYLVSGNQGRGIGSALLERGTSWIKQHWNSARAISANIKADNVASIHAFERAGFRRTRLEYRKELKG